MSVSSTRPNVAELIDAFTGAAPDDLNAAYRELVAALWHEGSLTDQALATAPTLVELMGKVDEDRQGYLAILLGLLAQAEYPATDGPVTAAVGEGVEGYLALLEGTSKGQPLSFALFYLLSHYPAVRERIIAEAVKKDIDADDLSRLDRAMESLDPNDPVLGRVFPSPVVWTFDEAEREFDKAWINSLTPEQVVESWHHDTRTVWGHSGAKAYWSVVNGSPTSVRNMEMGSRDAIRLQQPEPDISIFNRHAAAFRCPRCGGDLEFSSEGVKCASCSGTFPLASGILDLTATEEGAGDFLRKLAEIPSIGLFYEAYARPAFLRVCGSNWGDAVDLAYEDAYIADHVRPVDGPVIDMGAGAGRWTEVLADAVGAERVIALDMALPMLTVLRDRLPDVPAVIGTARTLPFHDNSVGAVVCWNALQAFPQDAAAAIAEVGRVLRPGGTFTLLTFRNPDDPIYRFFQSSHFFPQHKSGLRLFDLADVKQWISDAGLTIRHEAGPGTFVFITAELPR